MCDLICDVFEATIRVKSMYMIKSRLKPRKKDNMEIKEMFDINVHLKDGLVIKFRDFYGKLMPEGVLTSFTVCDACQMSLVRHS